jgi:Ca-activated chloride channel family protein
MIHLAYPAYLAIGVLLCLPYLLRPRRAWQYSSLHLLPTKGHLDFVTVAMAGLSVVTLSLLLVALSRPQRPAPQALPLLQAKDIILALDLSLSMEGHMPAHQEGMRHQRKLDVVQRAALEFVQRHPGDRLALIVFGDEAFGVWPLSTDSRTLLLRLQHLDDLIPAQLRGTHVEKALLKSLDHMRALGQASSKIILLLTDGLDTIEAQKAEQIVQRLQRDKIRLYVLGMQLNENSSVVRLVRRVEGGYYPIDKAEEMHRALHEIEQLEKTTVSSSQEAEFEDLYHYFAFAGLLLLLLAQLCKSVWVLEV